MRGGGGTRIKREFGNKTDGNCRERNTAGARVDMRTTAALIVVIVFRPLCVSLNRKCLPPVGSLFGRLAVGRGEFTQMKKIAGHLDISPRFVPNNGRRAARKQIKWKLGSGRSGVWFTRHFFLGVEVSAFFFRLSAECVVFFPFCSNRPPT